MIGTPSLAKCSRQIERRLATELNDDAIRLNRIDDVQHIFRRERFEEEHVARVVVGAYGLRIAIDHDRFDAKFTQRIAGVATAIVKLDPLADAIRATSENHDSFLVPLGWRFVFGFVGAVIVGRVSLELGRAGVNGFVGCNDASRLAPFANFTIVAIEQRGQLSIRETELL